MTGPAGQSPEARSVSAGIGGRIEPREVADTPSRPARRGLALGILCLALLIVVLDTTVLNVALPTLVRDLNASSTDLQWIVDAYVVVFAGLVLVSGSVADRVGRKWTFVAGLVAFAACSAWAALSGSVGLLIAARASMGMGGAMIMPSTLALISGMYPDPRERQRAFGFWAATTGAGVAIGPLVGGVLLAHFSWGSIFLINVPIATVALSLSMPFVPNSRNPDAGAPDLIGGLLSTAGLALLIWAIIEAPSKGWSSLMVIGAGTAAILVLAGFVLWEQRSPNPMLRLSFFRSRAFSVSVVCVSMSMLAVYGALFILTQFLQFDLGFSALATGIRLLPAAGTIIVVAPLTNLLDHAIGTKLTVALGLGSIAGGMLQLSAATVATTYGGSLPGIILFGLGFALVNPSLVSSVMGSIPPEHRGIGSATSSTFFNVGGALGVAVIGSLLSTRYQSQMTASVLPYQPYLSGHHLLTPEISSQIMGSVGGALGVAARATPFVGQVLAGIARSAFMSGMDLSLFTGAMVAVAAGLLALLALPVRAASSQGRRTPSDP